MNKLLIESKFHPDHGRIWLHEAYLKFDNAPVNCFITGSVVAIATPLQQVASLDLEIANGWITFAAGGPGTGTDGFADPNKIVLVPRTFSKDGDWNYDGVNLIPAAGNGEYKMTSVKRIVHRFVHKIPTYGTCPYFSITSDETTELPPNYFLEVLVETTDGSNFASIWHASVILEIYRERTYLP